MVSFQGLENFKAHVFQIIYQVLFAGMYILARIALIHGMDHFVFVTYRQVIATLAIAPFAYLFERCALILISMLCSTSKFFQ
jgi:hypothetical protein